MYFVKHAVSCYSIFVLFLLSFDVSHGGTTYAQLRTPESVLARADVYPSNDAKGRSNDDPANRSTDSQYLGETVSVVYGVPSRDACSENVSCLSAGIAQDSSRVTNSVSKSMPSTGSTEHKTGLSSTDLANSWWLTCALTGTVMSVATAVAVLRYICFDFEDIGHEVFPQETEARGKQSTIEQTKPTYKESAYFPHAVVEPVLLGETHAPQCQLSEEEVATSSVPTSCLDLNNNDQHPSVRKDHMQVISKHVVDVDTEETTCTPTTAAQEGRSEKPTASAEGSSSLPKATGQLYFDVKRVHDFLNDEGTAHLEVVPVLDILLEILSEKSLRPLTLDEITSKPVDSEALANLGTALEGLRLLTTFWPAHRCMYWEMVNKSVGEFRLTNRHGVYTTLQKYFELKHGVRLRFPYMPLIRIYPDQKIPIPVELLVVTDLPHRITQNIELALSQE